jgi:hypothetical protein
MGEIHGVSAWLASSNRSCDPSSTTEGVEHVESHDTRRRQNAEIPAFPWLARDFATPHGGAIFDLCPGKTGKTNPCRIVSEFTDG